MCRSFVLCILFLLFPCISGFAQSNGFLYRFEDNALDVTVRSRDDETLHTLWSTQSPDTYLLTEQNGVLKIDYERLAGRGANDSFSLTPPASINVSSNPRIRVSIKSSVATSLTIRPIYNNCPPTYEDLVQELPGDAAWHTVYFDLYPHLSSRLSIKSLDFFLDHGSSDPSSGTIEIDDLQIGGFSNMAINLSADVVDGANIQLAWNTTNEGVTHRYQVLRSTEPRLAVEAMSLVTEVTTNTFLDQNLDPDRVFYYKVLPVDTTGMKGFPSNEIRQETHAQGVTPSVRVSGVNGTSIKKYEKFEILLDLSGVNILNPYDPEDIDVFALFISPAGDTIRINGFYDDYLDVDQWKVRFSPHTVGEWVYQIFVSDAGGVGSTPTASFNTLASEHHGWIKPSEKNPHYFVHDDGTSYFAVGVYSPWRNNEERVNTFAEHNANLFAIWDIGYGGFVNETGIIEEELGRYNQEKLGRIDSLLSILEKHDINLMYAIWPHDLFSETVWAAEWDKNPYNQLIDVVDVYADSLVWDYQKKKYRYLIARFAHSRSMGIWELINEMNGTDGWAEGRHQEAYDWVARADRYFEVNDPYNHPVTASFSGGFNEYREHLYHLIDVPNLHVYPAQGWAPHYPADTVRSSMYNYGWASRRFWNRFDKPAIFGEAGADLAYYNRRDPEYHIAYHNAIWASLSNGLAGIPVWWQLFHLTAEDWDHLIYLSVFVSDIDFGNLPYRPEPATAEGSDVFALVAGPAAFGWMRSYSQEDISGRRVEMSGLDNGSFDLHWFDTWKGEVVHTETVMVEDGSISVIVPELTTSHPDIAFKITRK